jgi:hypothetical protein
MFLSCKRRIEGKRKKKKSCPLPIFSPAKTGYLSRHTPTNTTTTTTTNPLLQQPTPSTIIIIVDQLSSLRLRCSSSVRLFVLASHQVEPMTGKSSSTSKSNKPTKGHVKLSSKNQDRPSSKKESVTTSTSSQNTLSAPAPHAPQKIDLTETSDTNSTTSIRVHIPSLQHTKDLAKNIADLRQELEKNRQRRAVLDRKLAELENVREKSSTVVEASIWKHIYAQAHLRLLAAEGSLQHQNLSILFCFIGITLIIYIHFVDCF